MNMNLIMPRFNSGLDIGNPKPAQKPKRQPWTRTDQNSKTFDALVNRFREAGYDDYAIAGIIGNFVLESGYNFNAKGKRHGMGQMTKDQYDKMMKIYGNDEIQYYIDHASGNVNKKYSGDLGYKQGKMKKTYTNVNDAADDWLINFERAVILDPKTKKVIGYQDQDKRRAYASDVYNYLKESAKTNQKKNTSFNMYDQDLINDFIQQPVYTVPMDYAYEQQPMTSSYPNFSIPEFNYVQNQFNRSL